MKKSNAKRIYWGLVLIAVAVFIILKQIGVKMGFIGTLPTVDVAIAVIILSVTVFSAIELCFWLIPFELAAVFMLFEAEIASYLGRSDKNIISNWLLFVCALFLSVGLSLIIKPFRAKWHPANGKRHMRVGSETKYLDASSFESYNYYVRMADGSIYFENAENYKGGGVLTLECKMGNITVHVPPTWKVETDIDTSMGNLDTVGHGQADGPLLTIRGTCRMGNITITHS